MAVLKAYIVIDGGALGPIQRVSHYHHDLFGKGKLTCNRRSNWLKWLVV